MEKWIKCKISDIGKVVGGATPSTDELENYKDGTIPWITPKDLSKLKGRYIKYGERNITKYGLKSCSAQILPKNTILFSSRAPIGYIAITENEVCTNQGFKSIIPNSNIDSLFLFYILKYNKKSIENAGGGTTFKEISGSVMKSIAIEIPNSIKQQRKIANILDVLDKKIELNNTINDNLSCIAHNIYMYSFFRKKPSEKLKNILIENEKSTVQVGEAKRAIGIYPFFTSGETILRYNDYFIDRRNCFLNTGGNADVKFYVGKAAYSTDTWCIAAKDDMSDYLYLLLKSIKIELNKIFFQGTGLKHLQKDLLKNKLIYIPKNDEIYSFNKLVKPIFNIISENIRENQCLISLRDFLLPLLMNGQATICD